MDKNNIIIQEVDEFLVSQYHDFLPKRIFDAHMHMPYGPSIPNLQGTGVYTREAFTPEDYWNYMRSLLPGVNEIRLNMMPMPADRALRDRDNGLRDLGNNHIFLMQKLHPRNVVTPLILPNDTEEYLFQLANQPGCVGFKCYAYMADIADFEKAQIGQYLPESAWVVANERKLPIFLHLFRKAALSDRDNFLYITTMTHRYPNAQLVLAHCARGFASWTMMKSIKELEDQGNIWFDLSAICETGPMMACILKNAGKRTIWGSDYPCTICRGRAVSIGKWQNWLTDDTYKGPERALLPAENLMAFYQTALLLNLDQTQINDIFYNNAEFLFHKA